MNKCIAFSARASLVMVGLKMRQWRIWGKIEERVCEYRVKRTGKETKKPANRIVTGFGPYVSLLGERRTHHSWLMNASVFCRATSSGYWVGGDFMK